MGLSCPKCGNPGIRLASGDYYCRWCGSRFPDSRPAPESLPYSRPAPESLPYSRPAPESLPSLPKTTVQSSRPFSTHISCPKCGSDAPRLADGSYWCRWCDHLCGRPAGPSAQTEEVPNQRRSRREPIPKEVRREVWRRDEGRCVGCGGKERLEFDHIIPVSKGGSNTSRNLQLLCEKCNRKKSASI